MFFAFVSIRISLCAIKQRWKRKKKKTSLKYWIIEIDKFMLNLCQCTFWKSIYFVAIESVFRISQLCSCRIKINWVLYFFFFHFLSNWSKEAKLTPSLNMKTQYFFVISIENNILCAPLCSIYKIIYLSHPLENPLVHSIHYSLSIFFFLENASMSIRFEH